MKTWITLAVALSAITFAGAPSNASDLTRPLSDDAFQTQVLSQVPPGSCASFHTPLSSNNIDTAPIPGRPGSPGPGLPGGPGTDNQQDEIIMRLFYNQDKIDGKSLGTTLQGEYPALQIETLRFIKKPTDGGLPIYKKDGAIFFAKGRYDVKPEELPAILIKKNGQHRYSGSNQDLSIPNIEKVIKDTLQLDPKKPEVKQ